MLGFLKPRGELVELKSRQVVFLSEKKLQPRQQMEIKLSLPAPSQETLDLAVKVLNLRPGPDGRFVVVAIIESLELFEDRRGRPVREFPREPLRVTLKSQALPGYRTVTEDLSSGGFRADLAAELSVGDILPLTFEFDEPREWSLAIQAKVEWVRNHGGLKYQTGFSFPDNQATAPALEKLNFWLEHRGKRELGRLFKKTDFLSQDPHQDQHTSQAKAAPPEPAEPPRALQIAVGSSPGKGVRIPFEGVLRGWAWEQYDEAVVLVIEDVRGVDHWLEFPDTRGFHARCRSRKVHLQGLVILKKSPMIEAYSRSLSLEKLIHVQFLDDHARVCIDLVASGARVATR